MIETDGLPSSVIANLTGKRKQGVRSAYATTKGVYSHSGVEFEINQPGLGVYTDIMRHLVEQTTAMIDKYRRVLLVRFDLHPSGESDDNEAMTLFVKRAKAYIARHYYRGAVGYVWVREQEKAKGHHYHFALMLDGDVVRHHSKLVEGLSEVWRKLGGYLRVPEHPYYQIDSQSVFRDAIYRVSYMAKTRGKGFGSAGSCNFGRSQLPLSVSVESVMRHLSGEE